MKAYFLFNPSETIDGWLKFSMDWECPYLPRIGETIEPSIIMNHITPEMFREAMTEKSGAEWDKQIAEDHHEAELMKNWLIEMKMKVVDVSWGISYGEHYASFLLEETNCHLDK